MSSNAGTEASGYVDSTPAFHASVLHNGLMKGLEMAKTYYEKLKDPRWQKLRLEVMQAAGFHCQMCGDSESTLNVHHKEYFKGYEPWEYELKQLVCMCESCHEAYHEHGSFDALKYISSLLHLDGPGSRDECAILIAGFAGLDYEYIRTSLGMADTPYRRSIYTQGREVGERIRNGQG